MHIPGMFYTYIHVYRIQELPGMIRVQAIRYEKACYSISENTRSAEEVRTGAWLAIAKVAEA